MITVAGRRCSLRRHRWEYSMGVFVMKWLAFAAIALWAGAAQAAVIHIKPTLVAIYDADANYADVLESAVLANSAGRVTLRPSTATRIMQVDFSFTISDLQAGQLGFGNAAFNIDLTGALIQSPLAPGWNPDTRSIDISPVGSFSLWADNGDYGISGDLQSIVVGTDPADFGPVGRDPRRVLGRNGDESIGNIFIELPGSAGAMGQLRIQGDGGSVYNANNKLVDAGVTVTGGSIDFLVVPEPSSVVMLAMGCVMAGLYTSRLCVLKN
jgi:hypothetical protein